MCPCFSHCVFSGWTAIFQWGLNSFPYLVSPLHHSLDTRASYEIWFCWFQSLTEHVCTEWTGRATTKAGIVMDRQEEADRCTFLLLFYLPLCVCRTWVRRTNTFCIYFCPLSTSSSTAALITYLFIIGKLSLTANIFRLNFMGTPSTFTSVFPLLLDVNLA